MKTKRWHTYPVECSNCGSTSEILNAEDGNYAYDGDPLRCPECGMKGQMSIDSEGCGYDWDENSIPEEMVK